MSRIGKQPVELPKGVQVTVSGGFVTVKGPKGSLTVPAHKDIKIESKPDGIWFARSSNTSPVRAAHGLMRALCANMVTGVTKGFERQLEINGVGYRAEVKGNNLVLSLGYSHPVEFKLPDGVSAKVEKNVLTLSGVDKQVLGGAAAKIRSFRAPEPYKGKGVKYMEERIIRKAGKTAGK